MTSLGHRLVPLLAGAVLALPAAAPRAAHAQSAAPAVPVAADGATAAARRHYALGQAADSAGRAADARRHYEAALAADPGYVDASIALATVLIEANDASEAREVIARAVKRSPADPRLRNLRIRRRSAAAADSSASGRVPSDRKARAANPHDEGIALALAQVLATRGDQGGAAALFDTLVAVPAPSERVYSAAVAQALDAGDARRARALLEAGRARHPGSAALAALAERAAAGAPPR